MNHPSHGRRRAARTTQALVGASVAATAGLAGFVFAGTHTSAAADATTPATAPSAVTRSGGAATAPLTSSSPARPAAPTVSPAQPAAPTHASSGGS